MLQYKPRPGSGKARAESRLVIADDTTLTLLRSILKAGGSILIGIDRDGSVTGVMPEDSEAIPGGTERLRGSSLASRVRLAASDDAPGVEDNELIVGLSGSDGNQTSWLARRVDADGLAFAELFPQSETFVMMTRLAEPSPQSAKRRGARAAAEAGGDTLASGRSALEEINRKLKRRSRRLARALHDLKERNNQMVADMNLAVELQKSLLPKRYPRDELASFTHRYIPMAMVGGDFFDIIALPGDRIGVMVSDVSGHGVAPAFITAMIKSAFDYLVAIDWTPASVMTRLNAEFAKIIETEHYVTACYAVFDFESMTCTYCNAGHPPQLIVRRSGGFVELEACDPIIGMLDDHTFSESVVPFGEGDMLCFYTDGVVEARSAEGALFGVDGIKRSLASRPDDLIEEMADGLLRDLISFMRDPYFEDDITILLGQALESL